LNLVSTVEPCTGEILEEATRQLQSLKASAQELQVLYQECVMEMMSIGPPPPNRLFPPSIRLSLSLSMVASEVPFGAKLLALFVMSEHLLPLEASFTTALLTKGQRRWALAQVHHYNDWMAEEIELGLDTRVHPPCQRKIASFMHAVWGTDCQLWTLPHATAFSNFSTECPIGPWFGGARAVPNDQEPLELWPNLQLNTPLNAFFNCGTTNPVVGEFYRSISAHLRNAEAPVRVIAIHPLIHRLPHKAQRHFDKLHRLGLAMEVGLVSDPFGCDTGSHVIVVIQNEQAVDQWPVLERLEFEHKRQLTTWFARAGRQCQWRRMTPETDHRESWSDLKDAVLTELKAMAELVKPILTKRTRVTSEERRLVETTWKLMCHLLYRSGLPHLRKLLAAVPPPYLWDHECKTVVYLLVSFEEGSMGYVGQTRRGIFQRFWEHVMKAVTVASQPRMQLKYRFSKQAYMHLACIGSHTFLPLPLAYTGYLLPTERMYISRLPGLINAKRPSWTLERQVRAYRHNADVEVDTKHHTVQELTELASLTVRKLRLNESVFYYVDLVNKSQELIGRSLWAKLVDKINGFLKIRKLPVLSTLFVGVPNAEQNALRFVKTTILEEMKNQQVPPPLVTFYERNLRVVSSKPGTLLGLLRNVKSVTPEIVPPSLAQDVAPTNEQWSDPVPRVLRVLERLEQGLSGQSLHVTCPCKLAAPEAPELYPMVNQGHLLFKTSDDLTGLGELGKWLGQNLQSPITTSPTQQAVRVCAKLAKRVCKLWPGLKWGSLALTLRKGLEVLLPNAHDAASQERAYVVEFWRRFKFCYVSTIDKNGGCLSVACVKTTWVRHLRVVADAHVTTGQYQLLQLCSAPQVARTLWLEGFNQALSQNGLATWRADIGRAEKVANHSYSLLKEKSVLRGPWLRQLIKTRLVTSHYSCPTKPLAKKVARCLQVLVIACCTVFEVCEMPHTHMLPDILSEWSSVTPAMSKPCFKEKDLVNMFPSITLSCHHDCACPKKQCFVEFLKNMMRRVRQACGKRGCDQWFSVHRTDKRLDGFGMLGSPDEYEYVSWSQVLVFVVFELYFNNTFVLGVMLVLQGLGVPIGGPLSSQVAQLWAIGRELATRPSQPWGWNSFWDSNTKASVRLPEGMRVLRFRDNIDFLFDSGSSNLQSCGHQIDQWMTSTYGIESQDEGQGLVHTTLEVVMQLRLRPVCEFHSQEACPCVGGKASWTLTWRFRNKTVDLCSSRCLLNLRRYPSRFSQGFQNAVKLQARANACKAAKLSSSALQAFAAAASMVVECVLLDWPTTITKYWVRTFLYKIPLFLSMDSVLPSSRLAFQNFSYQILSQPKLSFLQYKQIWHRETQNLQLSCCDDCSKLESFQERVASVNQIMSQRAKRLLDFASLPRRPNRRQRLLGEGGEVQELADTQ
jgi:hypothetical protein